VLAQGRIDQILFGVVILIRVSEAILEDFVEKAEIGSFRRIRLSLDQIEQPLHIGMFVFKNFEQCRHRHASASPVWTPVDKLPADRAGRIDVPQV
jgi:hypothetical protein